MRKLKLIVILTLLLFSLWSCSDIGEASLVSLSIPEVENGTILFKGNELSKDVHINSNKDWKIDIEYLPEAKDWLIVRPSSGKGGESVHIEASDDYYKPDTITRSATLTLTVGDLQPRFIKIVQYATLIKIEVTEPKIMLNKEGTGKEFIHIDSNIGWVSTYEEFDYNFIPNWYKVNKTEGDAGVDSILIYPTQSNNSFSVNNSTLIIYPHVLELNDSIRYPHLFKKVIIWQPIKHFLEPEIPGHPITQPLEFGSSGGKRIIQIHSNVEWYPDNFPDWIKEFNIKPTNDTPQTKLLEITAYENSMQNGNNPGPKEGTFSIVGISDELDPIIVLLSQKPPIEK